MNRSRSAVAGVAMLATLVSAAACANKAPAAAPSPSLKPAMQVLTEAAEKTKGQSFKYTLTYGDILTGDGARDAAGGTQRNVTIKTGANGLAISAKLLHAGDRVFVKLDLGSLGLMIPGLANAGDRWLVINPARLNANGLSASLVPNADSSAVDSYIKGVVSAENVSATEMRGTIDITKSAPIVLPASEVAKLTQEQRIVPFTATLDSEGRIVKTVVNLPAMAGYPAAPLTTTYSDYGSALTISAPPESDSVDAPEALYLLLP